jgi:RND family efflux transporter MFP subunit
MGKFMKNRSYLWIFAVLGITSAIFVAKKAMTPPPPSIPKIISPEKPYPRAIAASGIIEASGENYLISAPQNGIVQKIYKEVWDLVKVGDPLFDLDSRELMAELQVAEAKEQVAAAQYELIHDQLQRLRAIKNPRAISQEEIRCKEHEEKISLSTLSQMKKEKEKIAVQIECLTIRSPIDGTVIQKNMKVGEYLMAGQTPPMMLGNTQRFQVRADVDEYNASKLVAHSKGIAYPKNRPDYPIPLTFVRIDPYVVPKASLTGSSQEKVDTRVLQLIYTFEPPSQISLYIGQQVDVYIEQVP